MYLRRSGLTFNLNGCDLNRAVAGAEQDHPMCCDVIESIQISC